MKNHSIVGKSETLEDIVFEGRNKSYGAYELNKKHRKYLIIALLTTLMGVSSVVAVPFIKAFKGGKGIINFKPDVATVLVKLGDEVIPPPPPAPPALPASIMKKAIFSVPLVVEEASPDNELWTNTDLLVKTSNEPVPDILTVFGDPTGEIIEPEVETLLYPEEPATFRDEGLNEFVKWVQENIVYPNIAIDNRIFGKVIVEFCVNARGEVVDVKILRGIDKSLDNEAIRVISASPAWIAAKQGGRPAKQRFVIPVAFRLE